MTSRAAEPANLGLLSGCAAELAEAFVSLASDIALIIDEQGVIQSVAQSPAAPITASASEWVGRPWVDTVTGDTRRKVELMLSDLKATGVARRREVNVAGVQSGEVPVAFSALRLGAAGPVLAVGRDLRAVSAIQQRFLDAQQELERGYWRARQAESRYRLLFQVATDAVLTVDARSLRVLEANQAAVSLLGTGVVLAGKVVLDLFDRSSRAVLQELLLNAGSTGRPAEVHVRLPGAQEMAAVAATPFRAGDGLRLLLRVRCEPGSESAAAADGHRHLAMMVEGTRDGVVVTDSSGRIMVANPAFLRLAQGVSEDEVRGRPIAGWVGRIESDVAALLEGAHQHGIAHLVRSSLRRGDGSSLDVDVTAALQVDGEQECFGLTISACESRPEPRAALAQALAALDQRIGELPLADLLAQSMRLIEQQLIRSALSRAQGRADAAAAMLGIGVEQLMQGLAPDDTARKPAREPGE
ncbi:MAG TPA: transcriptional regulator PpsR [Rubrivivax sp.]|nr:transcriptional regulator PpsR [Rubrivivax sp.]